MEKINLGLSKEVSRIKSSLAPFSVFPEYRVKYPQSICRALGELYAEYNRAFIPVISANQEWNSDYRHCFGQNKLPVNFFVQMDMMGLSSEFLLEAESLPVETVKERLRRNVFEIENSLAMYQLLEGLFPDDNRASFFDLQFRGALAKIKKQKGKKPIALLAVTEDKYQAMAESEFGVTDGSRVSSKLVQELSGFDHFFGPDDFLSYLRENGGRCGYLLYVRSSDPVAKLRKPGVVVEHPLLEKSDVRRVIKENSLTFNIDDPFGDSQNVINDTKRYQALMGLGFALNSEFDLFTPEFGAHLFARGKYEDYEAPRLSDSFRAYLSDREVFFKDVESGEIGLRFKPIQSHYGCYGHILGKLNDAKVRSILRCEVKKRGSYVVQLEIPELHMENMVDGIQYTVIDRVFFMWPANRPQFMGGFRSCMPLNTEEARNGRNHGSKKTVWAEIVD